MLETRPHDRIIFDTGTVCVGEFRCAPDHPAFRNSGPSSHFCFAFARTPVVICREEGRFVADPTVATFYNQSQEYEREPLSPRGDICEWFGVTPSLLRDVLQARDRDAADDPRRPIRFAYTRVTAATYLAQRRLYRRAAANAAEGLEVEERVVSLLDTLLASAYAAPARTYAPYRRQRDTIHDARALLAQRTAEPLALGHLARTLGVNMFHLCRTFRAATGQTLHDYRTQVRLRGALEQLESGRDLTRVALDAGFSSHSHFTAAFRRTFGGTPSTVRAEL